jgi:hypothetical protein
MATITAKPGVSPSSAQAAANRVSQDIGGRSNPNWRPSGGGGARGGGVVSASSTLDDYFEKYSAMIQANTAQNNAWSAQQAQLNRDWQERMLNANNVFNAQESQKNRDWQERLSNTAHQRQVKDLLAAGLNPVLSAMNGNGAATTSGATASAGSAPSGAVGQTDTSANAALVSLLGALVSSQVQQENARLSAETNLAVAEKYNQMSKYTAELGSATNLEMNKRSVMAQVYNGQLSARTALSTANINAMTSRFVAQLQANTSLSVAQINKAAQIVSASLHASATKYAADRSYTSNIVTTRMNNLSASNIAGINAQTNKALNDANIKAKFDFAEMYPSNAYQYDPGQANMRDWADTITGGIRDVGLGFSGFTGGLGDIVGNFFGSAKQVLGFRG